MPGSVETRPIEFFGVIFDADGKVIDVGEARKQGENYFVDTSTAKEPERKDKSMDLNNVRRIETTSLYILTQSPDRYCYQTAMGWKCVG